MSVPGLLRLAPSRFRRSNRNLCFCLQATFYAPILLRGFVLASTTTSLSYTIFVACYSSEENTDASVWGHLIMRDLLPASVHLHITPMIFSIP